MAYPKRKLPLGEQFGRLVVVKELEPRPHPHSRGRARVVLCRCACGSEHRVLLNNLLMAHTKSCGCLLREHRARVAAEHAAEAG